MCELLSINDHTQQFRSDGRTHRVGFIDRHPHHGSYGHTDFTRTAGSPFCRVYLSLDRTGAYWVAYPSELVLADAAAIRSTADVTSADDYQQFLDLFRDWQLPDGAYSKSFAAYHCLAYAAKVAQARGRLPLDLAWPDELVMLDDQERYRIAMAACTFTSGFEQPEITAPSRFEEDQVRDDLAELKLVVEAVRQVCGRLMEHDDVLLKATANLCARRGLRHRTTNDRGQPMTPSGPQDP